MFIFSLISTKFIQEKASFLRFQLLYNNVLIKKDIVDTNDLFLNLFIVNGDEIVRACDQGALSRLLKGEARAGAEGAILPYVGHLQLISTLIIGADCCQLCQYKLT